MRRFAILGLLIVLPILGACQATGPQPVPVPPGKTQVSAAEVMSELSGRIFEGVDIDGNDGERTGVTVGVLPDEMHIWYYPQSNFGKSGSTAYQFGLHWRTEGDKLITRAFEMNGRNRRGGEMAETVWREPDGDVSFASTKATITIDTSRSWPFDGPNY